MMVDYQDSELVCVLKAISEVAEKLAEKEKERLRTDGSEKKESSSDFERLSKVADIMSKCAKLGLSDNVMICALKAKGLLSKEEFKALSKF